MAERICKRLYYVGINYYAMLDNFNREAFASLKS